MATTQHAAWSSEGVSCPPKSRVASESIASGFLTISLLGSYLQYCLERSDAVRLIPIVFLLTGAFLFILTCTREKRRKVITAATRPGTLGIIAIVTMPPIISSMFYRATPFPFEYGIITIVALFGLRILLSALGFERILLSFFYATSAGILVVVGLNFSLFLTSFASARFAPTFFDPNRIAFFAATSIPVQLWYVANRRRYSVLLVTLLCLLVIFAASSRGSIGALLIGGLSTAVLYAVRQLRIGPFTLSRIQWIGILALITACTVVAGVQERAIANYGRTLGTKLALDDPERGLNTGFTGRTIFWAEVREILPKTSWLVGNGFRTSDEDFDFSLDNGYLASLYELGLFSTLVVLAKYAFILYFLAAVYLKNGWADGTSLPILFFTLVVFFANAFVHRVFFGIGEQASILTLFTFIATRQDVIDMLRTTDALPSSPGIQ